MTDDHNNKRKKKRGRKNNFSCSCFPSLITPTDHNNNSLDNDDAHITKNGRVLIPVDDDRVVRKQYSSHRPHFSRLVKAVLFSSLMAKKIHRSSSSKSSSMASSDTSRSYLTYDKTGDDNNMCVKECNDTDETSSRCRSNLLTSSSSSSSTNCSSNSYTTSSCSTSTFSTSRSSSQQKSSQIDLVDFRHPNIISKSFLLDQKVSSRLTYHPRHHLRHQDSSLSVSLPLSNPKPMKKSIHKSLSFQKGISQLDSSSFPSLTNFNRDKIRNNNNNGNNILWCFFLFLSLVVLIVYGRIFSILWTSTWFYIVPCLRIKRVNSSTNMTAFVDTDSEQYKKRVIMAGLLDRTRNPFR